MRLRALALAILGILLVPTGASAIETYSSSQFHQIVAKAIEREESDGWGIFTPFLVAETNDGFPCGSADSRGGHRADWVMEAGTAECGVSQSFYGGYLEGADQGGTIVWECSTGCAQATKARMRQQTVFYVRCRCG